MTIPPVTFYLPKLEDPSRYNDVDPDASTDLFRTARAQSIPHTYVRLQQAGHEVQLSSQPPTGGIAVVFAGDMRRFLADRNSRNVLIVCVQTDRRVPEVSLADIIVQHNGLAADGHRRVFIPNWPQTGLVPRGNSRGTSVRTIAYKGNPENLHRDFLSNEWARFLLERGLSFIIDADVNPQDSLVAGLGTNIRIGSSANWHDYLETDVVLAVRPPRRDGYRHKPAVKLVNAWRAGTPALLGPERAYRELRRSELDYLEITSLADAKDAVARLCDDGELYAHIVANGIGRTAEFSVESIVHRWERLFALLTGWQPSKVVRLTHQVTVPIRRAARGVSRRAAAASPWRLTG